MALSHHVALMIITIPVLGHHFCDSVINVIVEKHRSPLTNFLLTREYYFLAFLLYDLHLFLSHIQHIHLIFLLNMHHLTSQQQELI